MVAPLTPAPETPSRLSQDNDAFVSAMDAFLSWLVTFQGEINSDIIPILNNIAASAFTGTSTSSVAIGTGSKSFTTQTGLSFIPGMGVLASYDGSNYMRGSVTSYDSGTGALVMNVPSGGNTGSGTYADWDISISVSQSDLVGYALTSDVPELARDAVGTALTPGTGLSITPNDGADTITIALTGGVQSIPIPASSMTPRTTNGAAFGMTETSTNKIMVASLDFDQSTAEYAQIRFLMPKRWDEGTVTAQFYWTAGSTGNVVWGCQAVALSNDDALDTAFGTAQTVTDGVTAANDLMITSATAAITVGGSPAEGDLVVFQFYRDASNGSDTLAADAKLLGVILNITTNAGDDS